jgi:hypothetical protein
VDADLLFGNVKRVFEPMLREGYFSQTQFDINIIHNTIFGLQLFLDLIQLVVDAIL